MKPEKPTRKIITYGLRYSDYDRQRELFALRNNGDIEIVAEVAYEPEDKEIFFRRMSISEGLECEHDAIVVCGDSIEEASRKIANSAADTDGTVIEDVSDLAKSHFDIMKPVREDILKELVAASDENIHDRKWLSDKICSYGFFPFFKLAKEPGEGIVFSTSGILQVPDEFINLCLFLSDLKVKSAVEIGVAKGASSYIMAAILSRDNPEMEYHMVDICDTLVGFEEAQRIIPAIRKDIPKTSDDLAGKKFDFCFIDADHSYDGMMSDWYNVGQHAGITVFHDVFGHEYDGLNGGTVRGWQEIKGCMDKRFIREFSRYPDKWMGIGIVDRR